MDPVEIDWPLVIQLYSYGIQKFIFKYDVNPPDRVKTSIIAKNNFDYFEDIKWAFFNGK